MKDNLLTVEIPAESRRKKALITLAVTCVISAVLVGYTYSLNYKESDAVYIYIACFFAVGIFASAKYWFTKHQLTPEGEQAKKQRLYEKEQRTSEFFRKWHIRYPIAVFLLYLALRVLQQKPDLWFGAVFLALVAAYFGREVAVVLIAAYSCTIGQSVLNLLDTDS